MIQHYMIYNTYIYVYYCYGYYFKRMYKSHFNETSYFLHNTNADEII